MQLMPDAIGWLLVAAEANPPPFAWLQQDGLFVDSAAASWHVSPAQVMCQPTVWLLLCAACC